MLYFSRWKIISILLVVLAGLSYAAPNLLSKETLDRLPSWVPSDQMTLGLDLQGGSHLLVEIDRQAMSDERFDNLLDEARSINRAEKLGARVTGDKKNQIVKVVFREAEKLTNARSFLEPLTQPANAGVFTQGNVAEATITNGGENELLIEMTPEGLDNAISGAVTQSIEVIRNRIDQLGTTEPVVQRQGNNRIVVQVPGFDDPERLKDVIGTVAKLSFHEVSNEMSASDALAGRPPSGFEVYQDDQDPPNLFLLRTRAIVDGDDLVDAQSGFDHQSGEPIITFRFNTKGGAKFAQFTSSHVNEPFAIVLDNTVLSAPVIQTPILGGAGQISGDFSTESANDLAVQLRAGALPAKLNYIEERTVGSSLGADSIEAGKNASIIGAILVLIFMVMAYGVLGVIANVALIANIGMVIGILSLLGATLTLPGIAGIVLTMGMAVDSNVLIYERIREERRRGRNLIQSFDAGFRTAFATILDANITTFIAAIILFYLGSGPVRGFAITLAIGIITTVFTAYTFTRMMVALWVWYTKPKEMPKRPVKMVPEETKIGFMKHRKFSFPASALALITSIILFFVVSLNFGIDFKGGTLVELQTKAFSEQVDDEGNKLKAPANIPDIRQRLGELNLGEIQVQEFGGPADVLVRVESQQAGDNAEQSVVRKLRNTLENDYEFRRAEIVGPTVSGELAISGTIAIIAALLAIMVYIWFRFEWQFAVGAVFATLHDVILTIGMFAVLQLDFSLSSIAAVLTIVGYSLNDTVVVYDRIRENLRKYKKMPVSELLDLSINQTLSRTILTSITTLVALLALYFLGGEVLSSFTFAMIFGVLIGTYSSIFMAAPLLILFKLRPGQVAGNDLSEAEKEKAKTANTQPIGFD